MKARGQERERERLAVMGYTYGYWRPLLLRPHKDTGNYHYKSHYHDEDNQDTAPTTAATSVPLSDEAASVYRVTKDKYFHTTIAGIFTEPPFTT